jgi:hypothetical protein
VLLSLVWLSQVVLLIVSSLGRVPPNFKEPVATPVISAIFSSTYDLLTIELALSTDFVMHPLNSLSSSFSGISAEVNEPLATAITRPKLSTVIPFRTVFSTDGVELSVYKGSKDIPIVLFSLIEIAI